MEFGKIFHWEHPPDFSLDGKVVTKQTITHKITPVVLNLHEGSSIIHLKDDVWYRITYEGMEQAFCAATITLLYGKIEYKVNESLLFDLIEPAHKIFRDNLIEKADEANVKITSFPQMDEANVKEQLRQILNEKE